MVYRLLLYSKIDLIWSNEKNKKYHTVGTIPKSNIKMVERGKAMSVWILSVFTNYRVDRWTTSTKHVQIATESVSFLI
jgi:hypothetical protein